MAGRLRRAVRWFATGVLALGLLLALGGAALWWWAGQEGSLEWALERIARGQPLEREGVRGSVRSGWRIARLAWEHEGLRVEAYDIALEWQPLALLRHIVRLDEVRVGRVRVIDQRPRSDEPIRLPDSLALPWRVAVDEAAIGRLAYEGTVEVEASGLAAGYAFDGLRHRLELRSLQLAGGRYEGEASLLALAPMTLDARLAGNFRAPVPGAEEPARVVFEASAKGPLADFQARAELRVPDAAAAGGELPSASGSARITPLEKMPLPAAEAQFRALDVAQFWPSAPRTLLSGRLEVAPAGAGQWRLRADVRNGAAGPWDAQRLPLEQARVDGEWRDGAALVRSLQARVGQGRIEGEGAWQGDGWRFEGEADALNPARLHSRMAALPLSGPLKLSGQGAAIAFDVALQAAGPAGRRARGRAGPRGTDALGATLQAMELREVTAEGRYADRQLTLPRLRVRTADARLEGELQARLAARAGSGRLRLQVPGLEAQVEGELAAARGRGEARLRASDLAQAQRWLARWPGLAAVAGTPLRGAAQGSVAWQGGWNDPTVQAQLAAQRIEWGAAPGDPAAAPWVLRDAVARLEGRLRDARVELRAQAQQGQRRFVLAAQGRAGQADGGWSGQLASLQLRAQDPAAAGEWQLQLRQTVPWSWRRDTLQVAAGEALLRAPVLRSGAPASDAVLAWGPLRRQGGELTTSGRLSGLPMAWIELFGGPQLAGSALSGDMVFDARWDAQLGAGVRVQASLERVRGDVNVLAETADGAATRVAAGVREARLDLTSQGEQLTLGLRWDSERAGQAQGEIRTRLVRADGGGWRWPADAPLDGRVRAQLPRLGVWSLLAPPGWRLRGSVAADIAIAGTRTQPRLSGPLSADDLALRSVVDGVELRNGRLRAELQGQRLVVREFLLRGSDDGGGGGTLAAYGEGEWTPQGLQLQVNAQLTALRASIRSDRQLTVSGAMAATMDRGGTRLTGDLVVDRAEIRIPDETAPTLGDDVVVRNVPGVAATDVERRLRPAPSDAGRTVTMAVSIDLGRAFHVAGRGVDTRLEGTLRMEGRSLEQPRLTGVIHAVAGKYDAYGQRMDIERGVLRFTGPVDNPALDVLAVRPNTTPRVGVQITGRAQAPHVELWSEAGLSEAETLSWLVLGRSYAGGGAETALLQRAATALLAGRRGTGRGIASSLGLDDLSVRGGGSSGAIVRVGKRFAENFYAAYERSLSGATGTLYIFYDVSRRLTVRAEAGERTGLDLIITLTFDRMGRR